MFASLSRMKPKRADDIFLILSRTAAIALPVLLGAIFVELVWQARLSIGKFGFGFFTSTAWNPVTQEFGAFPSIYGTVVTTAIALLIAVPLGLVIALFLVELAPPKLSTFFGGAIELLAAVPSIIYGMWGLFILAPYMSEHVQPALQRVLGFLPLFRGPPMGIGMLTAGVVLSIMVLPYIASVSRDVFSMVPSVIKEAGYGTGATKWEVAKGITLRHGMRGVIGAGLLALGRALGETMAVTFVIGNSTRAATSLFDSGTTIASTLANEFSEASSPIYLSSLVELGLVLLIITLLFQLLAQLWLKKIEK